MSEYQAVTLTMVKERLMFRWGIIFLVIALIAAALGFGGLAGTAAGAAKIVFVVGIILFLVSLFMGRKRP
ncbi:putative inner membrane protein [Escherichia coli H605]|nr:putative inner membrane protein [Escherichia coli H605]